MNQADQQAKERKRKMKSTAGKIHRLFLGKLLLIFLFFDIALGGLFTLGTVYLQEKALLGEFSPKTVVDLRHSENQVKVYFDNGEDRVLWTPGEDFLDCLRWGGYGILGVEGLLLLWAFLFYRFPIRRRLAGKVTRRRLPQYSKARSPISSSPSGRVIPVSSPQ